MDAKTDPSLRQQVDILKEQLSQAQRLTALGELVSTTTHEFNNVLMTIINYAKLGMRHRDNPTREKAFEKILAAGNRAAKITNSVLGMARSRGSDREPTALPKLIEAVLKDKGLGERAIQELGIGGKPAHQFVQLPQVGLSDRRGIQASTRP